MPTKELIFATVMRNAAMELLQQGRLVVVCEEEETAEEVQRKLMRGLEQNWPDPSVAEIEIHPIVTVKRPIVEATPQGILLPEHMRQP